MVKREFFGGAVTNNSLPAGVLDNMVCAAEILAKFVWCQISWAAVVKSAARNLMAARRDLAYQVRIGLSDPAKNKKRRLSVIAVEDV